MALWEIVMPHAFKTGVVVAASTHFAAVIPSGFMLEHTASTYPLTRDLVEEPVTFKDGYVRCDAEGRYRQ